MSNPGFVTNPPVAMQTVDMQRTPVYDGASGLHYSGKVYMNQFEELSIDLCKEKSVPLKAVDDIMKDGVSSPDLPVDPTTNRISSQSLQAHVQTLQNAGKVPGQYPNFEEQMKHDKAFNDRIRAEYCFYEARYSTSLDQFLMIASRENKKADDVDNWLNKTIALNKRLNSLLEILNHVANDRASRVDQRNPKLDEANKALHGKISVLQKQQEFLQSSDVHTRTQEEMMRYSAEKSKAMNVQIMFFVVLNVIALGTVLTVYKSSRGA
jgi:hypothetical protein